MNREREINNFRNQLRTSNIENINERHYEYQAGIYYMDLVANLEKTGDYIINVVDAVREADEEAKRYDRQWIKKRFTRRLQFRCLLRR